MSARVVCIFGLQNVVLCGYDRDDFFRVAYDLLSELLDLGGHREGVHSLLDGRASLRSEDEPGVL